MKKSMIISTIAMIVVVVVALSTATYAWFTSSAITKATVTMTVQSTGDFAIAKGATSDSAASRSYTFTQAATAVTLSDDMSKNIYAPTTPSGITTMGAQVTAGGTLSATNVSFVTAQMSGPTAYANGASAIKDATVIRVSNISGNTKTLTLSIVMKLNADGNTITDGTLRSAAATSFAIAYATGESAKEITNASFKLLTNGYNVTSETTYADKDVVAKTTAIPASNGITKLTTTDALKRDVDNNPTSFKKVSDNKTALEDAAGLSKDDYYYAYTISIGNVKATEYVYFVFYTWFDGILLDDTAKNSSLDITYAFYDASASGSSSGGKQS